MNDKKLFKNLGKYIFIIVIGGFLVFLGIEYAMKPYAFSISSFLNRDNLISTQNLEHLANYSAPFGIILSSVTILLLYANFRHQQLEFSKMNDLPLALHEKERLRIFLKKFNREIIKASKNTTDLNTILGRFNNLLTYIGEKDPEFLEQYRSELYDDFLEIIKELKPDTKRILSSYFKEINRKFVIIGNSFANEESIRLLYTEFDVIFNEFVRNINEIIDVRDLKEYIEKKTQSEPDESLSAYLNYSEVINMMTTLDNSLLYEVIKNVE